MKLGKVFNNKSIDKKREIKKFQITLDRKGKLPKKVTKSVIDKSY